MGNQKRKDGKNTNGEVSGRTSSHNHGPAAKATNTTENQRGKTPNWTVRLIAWKRKIGLIQGLNSFGTQTSFKHVLVPQHDDATQGMQPNGTSQLKKYLTWKGAGRHLPSPVWLQLPNRTRPALDRQRMEKKSSEIFREYTQWWREMAASGHAPF
uniref:Uncharacterized protein n=1 Tax=Fagus sylvatica TaxID=28930 RepID=A0A2N9FEF6_FAGSY